MNLPDSSKPLDEEEVLVISSDDSGASSDQALEGCTSVVAAETEEILVSSSHVIVAESSGKAVRKWESRKARKQKRAAEKEKSESKAVVPCVKYQRPNYFVSMQIKNVEIRKLMTDVQNALVKHQPLLKHCLVPVDKSHVTLMVMRLDEEHCLHNAGAALTEAIAKIAEKRIDEVKFECEGIGHFSNRVVFAKLKSTPASDDADKDGSLAKLTAVADAVRTSFEERGIRSSDDRPLNPHLTIAKLNGDPRLRRNGLKKILLSSFEELQDTHFGCEVVRSLQICSMEKPQTADGYYYCPLEMNFVSTTSIAD